MKISGLDFLENDLAGQILDDLDDGILIINPELVIEFANKAAISLFGVSKGVLTGNRITEYFPFIDKFINIHRSKISRAPGNRVEAVASLKGKLNKLSLVISGVFDSKNSFYGFSLKIKRAQVEPEINIPDEKKYKALFKDVQEGIIVMDDKSRIVEVNPAACSIFGIPQQEFTTLLVRNLFPHNSDIESDRLWAEFIRKGKIAGFYKYQLKSGEFKYLDFKGTTNFVQGLHMAIFFDVTEKRQTQLALRVSESQLKAIFDSTSQLVFLFDLELKLLKYNKTAKETIKYISGYDIPLSWSLLKHIDKFFDKVLDPEIYLERVLTGESASFEAELKSYPGYWFEVCFSPVYDRNNNIGSICITCLDISLRKQAELSLGASEARFRSLVQNSSDLIAILNSDGEFLYYSSSFHRILSYSDQDLFEKRLQDLVCPEDLYLVEKLLTAISDGEEDQPISGEFRIKHVSGGYLSLESIFNNQTSNPFIKGIVMNARDMTLRKRQEDNLRLLERAIDSSENGIFITDPTIDGNPVVYINKAFQRITGYSDKDVLGKDIGILFNNSFKKNGIEKVKKAFEQGLGLTDLMKNYRKNGDLFWNEFNISPVFNHDDKISNFIGVINDVSEKKNAEDALNEIISGLASVSEQEFFETLVKYLSWTVKSDIIFIAEVKEGCRLCTKAFLYDNVNIDDMELQNRDTPWYNVVDERNVIISDDIFADFPGIDCLPNSFTSFIGLPLIDSSGKVVGVLGAVNRGEFENLPFAESLLNLFSIRTSAELERQQYLSSLKESEEKFRALAENSPDLILIYNLIDKKVEYINRDVFWGYSAEELTNSKNWEDAYHHEDRSLAVEYLLGVIKGEITGNNSIDLRVRTKDGNYEWGTNRISILEKEGKWTKKVLINISLITERKRAEQALKESEEKLKALTENTNDLLFSVDAKLSFTTMNTAFLRFMRHTYGRKLKIGMDVASVFNEDFHNIEWYKLIKSSLKNKKLVKEISVNAVYGNESFEVLFNPIYDIENQVKGVSVFARDITRRKNAENDIKRTNFELDSFVYRASHDLRAPLRSVMGLISLVKIEENRNQRTEYLELANKSITKLDSFIGDLTDFSRNSRMDLKFIRINFAALIDDTMERLQFMDKAANIVLKKNIDPEIEFVSDFTRLSIVVQNLLSNAIKYQNEYTARSECEISLSMYRKREIEIWVRDNGIGIRKEFLPKVFDMFFRASHESYGSGLGLYITKQVVEKLNGSISVQSEPGKGTCFRIILPLIKV